MLAVGENSANVSRMNLEDHPGDIIRKARLMSAVSAANAAGAAGISETELSALEESGRLAQKINFAALGKILGLNPQKLEIITNGWLPAKKDLSIWHELRPFTTAGEDFSVNCYLVWDEVTRDAALFDTGLDARPLIASPPNNFPSVTFSSRTRTMTTSRPCRNSARRSRRRGFIPVPKMRP